MTTDISYTTEEISKLLKISKLTVYDLIKKGELPAYRVGKQMRVDAQDLEAYKARAKGNMAHEHQGEVALAPAQMPSQPHMSLPANQSIVITGQDVSLDILAKYIEKNIPTHRPLRSFVGSLDSLIAMYKGESDIVSTHLLDGESGDYNLPYIQKILTGFSYTVVNLVSRTAGLYVSQGNPKQLQGWDDLGKPGLVMVNREKGSGARVLLDEQLRLHHIHREKLVGYDHEELSHLAVAGKVATGEADVAVGIEKTAHMIGGVDFIPLIKERYDLVMLRKPDTLQWVEQVKQILQSEAFQSELRPIEGYDLSRTGEVLLET